MGALSEKLKRWLNGEPRYPAGHPIADDTFRRELRLGTLLDHLARLDDETTGGGSDLVVVVDSHSVFTATSLTEVLYELYVAATTSSSDTFTDSAEWYPVDQVGPAYAALALAIGGEDAETRAYSSQEFVAADDDLVVAIGKLDAALATMLEAPTPIGDGDVIAWSNDAEAWISTSPDDLGLERLIKLVRDTETSNITLNATADAWGLRCVDTTVAGRTVTLPVLADSRGMSFGWKNIGTGGHGLTPITTDGATLDDATPTPDGVSARAWAPEAGNTWRITT